MDCNFYTEHDYILKIRYYFSYIWVWDKMFKILRQNVQDFVCGENFFVSFNIHFMLCLEEHFETELENSVSWNETMWSHFTVSFLWTMYAVKLSQLSLGGSCTNWWSAKRWPLTSCPNQFMKDLHFSFRKVLITEMFTVNLTIVYCLRLTTVHFIKLLKKFSYWLVVPDSHPVVGGCPAHQRSICCTLKYKFNYKLQS